MRHQPQDGGDENGGQERDDAAVFGVHGPSLIGSTGI
jgi:hypothetical protein